MIQTVISVWAGQLQQFWHVALFQINSSICVHKDFSSLNMDAHWHALSDICSYLK